MSKNFWLVKAIETQIADTFIARVPAIAVYIYYNDSVKFEVVQPWLGR